MDPSKKGAPPKPMKPAQPKEEPNANAAHAFAVPPGGAELAAQQIAEDEKVVEIPPQPEGQNAPTVPHPDVSMQDQLPEDYVLEAKAIVDDDMIKQFVAVTMIPKPLPFTREYTLIEGIMSVVLRVKTVAESRAGWQWLETQVSKETSMDHYLQAVAEADLASTIHEMIYTLPSGDTHRETFAGKTFEERMGILEAYPAPKMSLLIEVLYRFIALVTELRDRVKYRGF